MISFVVYMTQLFKKQKEILLLKGRSMSIRYSKIQNLIIYIGDIIGITIGYFLMANFRYFYVETSVWIKDSQVIYRWMVAVFVLTIVYLAINPNQGFLRESFGENSGSILR